MKEFQDENSCLKCGKDKPTCEYKHRSDSEDEHLLWTCLRCGYVWKTKPKTIESEDDYGSKSEA